MNYVVRDLASHPIRFHAERISENRHRTLEGYLVVVGVPLARTGFQDYGGWEIEDPAVTPMPQYRVERLESEVFHPDSIASWHGKSITNDHPPMLLGPDTVHTYEVGTMIDPRRGTGEQKNLLLVDFIVKNPQAIADIEAGKVEVSGGYGCDYFEVEPGHLQQRNIRGNHGAIVTAGRCGPACAIGDQEQPLPAFLEKAARERAEAQQRRIAMNVMDVLRRALKSGVAKDIENAMQLTQVALDGGGTALVSRDEGPGGHEVHIHVGGVGENAAGKEEQPPKKEDPMDEAPPWFKAHHSDRISKDAKFDAFCSELKDWRGKVDAFMGGKDNIMQHSGPLPMTEQDNKEIEGELKEEAPPGTAEDAIKGARDSAILVDAFQATCAGAEVLVPGITLPRLDRNAAPLATFNVICGLRRQALDAALSHQETREIIMRVTGGRTVDTKTAKCSDVRNVFRTAVAMKQMANAVAPAAPAGTADYGPVGGIESPAALNQLYNKHFADLSRPVAHQNNGHRR